MKVAIIFYSHTGVARKISAFLRRKLESMGVEGTLAEIKLKKEEKSEFTRILQAVLKKTPEINPVDCDTSLYDLLIFGAPVWAGAVAPAMRSYLNAVKTFAGKKTAYFLSCGNPGSAKGALQGMGGMLREKKAAVVFSAGVPAGQARDEAFLQEHFKPLFEIIRPRKQQ